MPLKNITDSIVKKYRSEYHQKIFPKKMTTGEKIALGLFAGGTFGMVLAGTVLAAPFVAVVGLGAVSFGSMIYITEVDSKNQKQVTTAIKEDIANGVLIDRYRNEKIAALKEDLLDLRTLRASFEAAQTKQAEATPIASNKPPVLGR